MGSVSRGLRRCLDSSGFVRDRREGCRGFVACVVGVLLLCICFWWRLERGFCSVSSNCCVWDGKNWQDVYTSQEMLQ